MARKTVYKDQAFTDEQRQLQAAREEEALADREDFAALWAKRLETPLPPLHPSAMHHHEPDCWGEPFDIVEHGFRITVRRCEQTRVVVPVKEVKA